MKELSTQLNKVAISPFEGTWVSKNGDMRINCKLTENTLLESTWDNQFVEYFQIESQILKGVKNPEIRGFPLNNDLIKWNTGNHWVKEGKDRKLKKLIILYPYEYALVKDMINNGQFFNFQVQEPIKYSSSSKLPRFKRGISHRQSSTKIHLWI